MIVVDMGGLTFLADGFFAGVRLVCRLYHSQAENFDACYSQNGKWPKKPENGRYHVSPPLVPIANS
jgi:hypothetical protein